MTEPATGRRSVDTESRQPASLPRMVGRRWRAGGPVFVLLHGLGVASRMVAPLAQRLANLGTAVAPDMQGFGARSNEDALGIQEQARVLAARFGSQRPPVTVSGCSLGAQIAVHVAALLGPSLRALVLASPTVDRHRRSWPAQLSRWPLEVAVQPSVLRRIQIEDHRAAGYPKVLRTFADALADRPERLLDRIQAPTLVLRGTRDPLVSHRWAAEVAGGITDGDLAVIHARHPMTFTEPDLCDRRIRSFLERTEAPAD